jgi:hypothetical protein
VFRDGKLCTPDRLGLEDVASKLKRDKVVPDNFEFSVVEVHKNSAYQPRIFWEQQRKTFNPDMGSYREISTKETILCTTGNPLLSQGTADPVHLVLVGGRLTILEAIEDFYALSQLGFSSPHACHRLAFPLALADQILRERRPERSEEQPWDDDENEEKPVNLDDNQRRIQL